MIWGRILSIIAGIVFLSIVSTAFPAKAHAATDWLNDELTTTRSDTPLWSNSGCAYEYVKVKTITDPQSVCIYEGDGWRYGEYTIPPQFPNTTGEIKMVVSFPGDEVMYLVEGLPQYHHLRSAGNSSHVIFEAAPWSYASNPPRYDTPVSIIKNFPSKIQRTADGYMLRPNSIEPLITDENGDSLLLKSVLLSSASKNGKWFAAMIEQVGLVRINLETFEKHWFSKYKLNYSQQFGVTSMPSLFISNDGRFIGRSGWGVPPTISSVSEECGREFTTFHSNWSAYPGTEDINPCPERDVSPEIRGGKTHTVLSAQLQGISSDGNEIDAYVVHWTLDDNNIPQILESEGHFILHQGEGVEPEPPFRLDYLGLGDSYSSGEGDTERNQNGDKYYRAYTNNAENKPAGIPREKCHVSMRSYPYRLAHAMDLAKDTPQQWDTVACSGAKTVDVIPHDRDSDRGQESRLAGFSNYADLKTQALNEMIPGRVKQVNFVKKYQPKAITLTMGGNDVGFGDKLKACVSHTPTCEFAKTEYRSKFKNTILDQFNKLTKLYTELITVSYGQTKVYVLGYPQFINDSAQATCTNTFWMDVEERKMAVQAVSLMNEVIEKAAKKAGAYYIDIENSLGNHKLCDSEQDKYMTAITGYHGWNGNEEAESFHPNAKGHEAIASTVMGHNTNGVSLVDFEVCPGGAAVCPDYSISKNDISIPPYFQMTPDPPSAPKTEYKTVTFGDQVAGTFARVLGGLYTVYSSSLFDVYLHSDPIHLGTFEANEDGSIDVEVPIPANVTPGYHTLVLKGKTYSGDPIEYEQVILVKSSNPNDIDGDGIADAQDKCLFIPAVNIDADGDGIDDACDPEIGEAPQDPYRVRAGNPAKTYAGQPEKANNLYVERNRNAATVTGISGDYDADGDGWVVVATSQNTTGALPYAKFWLTGADGSKVPHLSFRTAEQGCVQYKPANLAVVTQQNNNSLRQLAQEAQDTNSCRSESPEADADSNGLPDSTQPLYMARNGNVGITHTLPNGTTFTEDSRHLYLFRSTRAAEVQLGKSDYARHNPALSPPATIPPTDTKDYRQEWSLIATTNPATQLAFAPSTYAFPYSYSVMNGTYKKIDTVNGQPFVVTTLFSAPFFTNCAAYKSSTLATIKQTSQHAQRLTQDWQQTMVVQTGGC